MKNSSTLSLTGITKYNCLSLSGTGQSREKNIPEDIKKIKIMILNDLLIPLISKQWSVLNENLFLIEKAKKKIHYYYDKYKLEDLSIYKEIIKAFEMIVFEHKQLEDLERKLYGSSEDITTMIYKTNMIRLKPEYEIYDIIIILLRKAGIA